MIRKIIEKYKNIHKAKQLLSSLHYEKKLKNKKIVFFSIRPYSLVLHQELFLAYQFAELGADVKVVVDDGVFEHWDLVQEHDNTTSYTYYQEKVFSKITKLALARLIINAYKHKNIKIVYTSSLANKEKLTEIDRLTTLEKQQAESSVRRFFEIGSMDLSLSSHKEYYEKSLMNCLISKTLASVIYQSIGPDLFITSHGIYSVWGPAFNYMKEQKVPSLIYGAHAYKSQEIIISDVIAQTLSQDSDWKNFEKNHFLSKKETLKVEDYFDKRVNFKASDTKIYYGDIVQFEEIVIPKSDDIKTFALFPNIIWDGDVYERDTIFKGIIDWIIKTVDIFRESPHNLVIRFHPAETTLWKDSKSLQLVLEEKIPDIKDIKNIFLISSDKKINTYDFIAKNVDIGLIYDGMLAMELLYIKKPFISCAISRYTGSGFAYEPDSIETYKLMLLNPERIISDFENTYKDKKQKMLKYAYWYLFVCGYHFPIFNPNKVLTIDYNLLSEDDVSVNKNKKLARTIDKFLKHLN